MKALLLAAGLGSRLRPLTDFLPKPLLPVVNRPCIEYMIEMVARAGIRDIAINTHHLADQIPAVLGDGSRFGVRLTYSYEPELLDTIGTLKSLESFWGEETVIMVNSDIVIDLDLEAVIRFHRERNALATIVVKPTDFSFPHPVGVDAQGRMRQIRGQPPWNGEPLQPTINVGINLFEPRVWREYVPSGVRYALGTELYPDLLRHEETVYGYPWPHYWADIGTPQAYLQAQFEVLEAGLSLYRGDLEEKEKGVWVGTEVAVEAIYDLTPPVIIGKYAQISPSVLLGPHTIIGPHCRIQKNNHLQKTILFPHTHLDEHGQLRQGIVLSFDGPPRVKTGGRYRGLITPK